MFRGLNLPLSRWGVFARVVFGDSSGGGLLPDAVDENRPLDHLGHNVAKPSLFPDSVNPPIRLRPKRVYGPLERLPTHSADRLAELLPDARFAAHPHARGKATY